METPLDQQARKRRRLVNVVHKSPILTMSDGLFRETCYRVAQEFPDVAVEEQITEVLPSPHHVKLQLALTRVQCKCRYPRRLHHMEHQCCPPLRRYQPPPGSSLFPSSNPFRGLCNSNAATPPAPTPPQPFVCAMIRDPTPFDVVVMPNMYGDFISEVPRAGQKSESIQVPQAGVDPTRRPVQRWRCWPCWLAACSSRRSPTSAMPAPLLTPEWLHRREGVHKCAYFFPAKGA